MATTKIDPVLVDGIPELTEVVMDHEQVIRAKMRDEATFCGQLVRAQFSSASAVSISNQFRQSLVSSGTAKQLVEYDRVHTAICNIPPIVAFQQPKSNEQPAGIVGKFFAILFIIAVALLMVAILAGSLWAVWIASDQQRVFGLLTIIACACTIAAIDDKKQSS